MVTVSARFHSSLGLSSRSISHAFCSQPKSELSSPILRALLPQSIICQSSPPTFPYSSALFPQFLSYVSLCLLDWSRTAQSARVSLVVAVLLSRVSRADKSSSVLETGRRCSQTAVNNRRAGDRHRTLPSSRWSRGRTMRTTRQLWSGTSMLGRMDTPRSLSGQTRTAASMHINSPLTAQLLPFILPTTIMQPLMDTISRFSSMDGDIW